MTRPELLSRRLEDFASRHGISLEEIRAQVDASFGETALVVAAGSVLAGFGNASSDLDLYAVVRSDAVGKMPLMSYPNGAKIDVALHGERRILTEAQTLAGSPWPPSDIGPALLRRRRSLLDSLGRLSGGLPLSGGDDWSSWRIEIHSRMAGWLLDWYAVEATRRRAAAAALRSARPRAAALRAAEAVSAALERTALRRGETYFTSKWVGEKMRRLADGDGGELFRRAHRLPVDEAEARGHVDRMDEILGELLTDVDTSTWRIRLRLATGTTLRPFGGTTFADRWQMRTVEVPTIAPDPDARWAYALDEPWPGDVVDLFAADMLWAGVEAPGATGEAP